ncbi:hypothetical protein C5F44_09445 [Fuscovulum blasticum DSM 2131]|uniref:Cation/multidrug efflux pump n=1 Tax=Fuscovulum blasticum DSM 2131 TaxID=1188250 RepID=A0A2T4J9Q3_FUSBL|nr:hypothetical protein [Fuscovulum blasticum]AWD23402.1 hypothetical protein B6K69_08680 [Fuscovulum blasticum]PTE14622.1 hypothetical protein C5F44_09445 [Fuscovulum blasticum DSM 2131]
MIGWLRLMAFALVGLTIIYFFVGLYSRSVRREKLEKRWVSEGLEGDRDAWIEEGMKAYDRGLKKKLLWLIYILPLTAATVAFYVVNFK